MRVLTPNPIKTARKRLKMTGEQLATEMNKLTGGNLTKSEISNWENTKHKPNQNTIFMLAKVLNQNPVKFYQEVTNHFIAWKDVFKKETV